MSSEFVSRYVELHLDSRLPGRGVRILLSDILHRICIPETKVANVINDKGQAMNDWLNGKSKLTMNWKHRNKNHEADNKFVSAEESATMSD